MIMDTFLNKLLQKEKTPSLIDTKCYIFMQSKWSEDSVVFAIQDAQTDKCYRGVLSVEYLKDSAIELELPYDDFYQECKNALTAQISLPGFEYEIDEGEMVFRLTKKQEFDIQYLEIKLNDLKDKYTIMDTAINLIEKLKNAANEGTKNTTDDLQNYDEIMKAVNICEAEKNNFKNKVCTKFMALINSKKERISQLEAEFLKNGQNIEYQDDSSTDIDCNDDDDKVFDAMTEPMTQPIN